MALTKMTTYSNTAHTNTSTNNGTNRPNKSTQRRLFMAAMAAGIMTLTGCQTMSTTVPNTGSGMVNPGQSGYPELLDSFNIRGKIGVTTPQTATANAQTGSAFYVWAQEDERFAIDITGALGIGHTVIEYNGSRATLVSERTGEISANTPEELLVQATGWQAPISQLRYWISGRPAPSDVDSQLDAQGRIQSTTNATPNGDWNATFTYKNTTSQLPSKIKVVRGDGHRVIMTIDHTQ